MDALPRKYLTQQEYLAIERAAQWKSEYYQGEMFAMAGGSNAHNRLIVNLTGELFNRLKGTNCLLNSSDLRIQVSEAGLYTYPDLSIVCGQQEFADGVKDTLTNPVVIVEVLSPSTESYDRGEKFRMYRQLPSLREYILIAQDRPFVDQFIRDDEDRWFVLMTQGLESVLTLQSCGVSIPMSALYENVEFANSNEQEGG
ncbi:MAG: Uma2 family endonuclease [Chlorobi bacterium]|nr:MAG: hypothetical protein UZ07_CHB004000814 [Chlorobi bacterium OLB7]MBK8912269.1 Uma2 family endonuclease [Chlorobiota bacterium]MBX7215985.1 Uma2 family endonuclease [Candidatus Kapabacteria bacterium]